MLTTIICYVAMSAVVPKGTCNAPKPIQRLVFHLTEQSMSDLREELQLKPTDNPNKACNNLQKLISISSDNIF